MLRTIEEGKDMIAWIGYLTWKIYQQNQADKTEVFMRSTFNNELIDEINTDITVRHLMKYII